MLNIKKLLADQLRRAYNETYQMQDKPDIKLISSRNPDADYKVPIPAISSFLKRQKIVVTDIDLVNTLSRYIDRSDFTVVKDANAPVINIQLKSEFINKLLFSDGVTLEHNLVQMSAHNVRNSKTPRNILVDFSSPNIAKDMHVGHLRSTIIGDTICKLFEFQGDNVLRINHIGDFGLQFGMIIEYLFKHHPNYENEEFNITDLQTFYALSKREFDADPGFAKSAHEKVVALQTGDARIVKAWQTIKEISRRSYNDIYRELGIRLDEVGESFYQNLIPQMVAELEAYDPPIMILEDGRKIIRVPNEELVLTVTKSDGSATYDTTDLCALWYRLTKIKPQLDKIIYVVDSGQAKHFQLIFWVAEKMGWKKPEQEIVHVGFGVICGADGKKFKSRDGDTVKLKELLDESVTAAAKIMEMHRSDKTSTPHFNQEEKTHIVKSLAYASIKYADLRSVRTKDYNFSTDRMLSLKGDTGVYQLYEYVRICGILRKANSIINIGDLLSSKLDANLVWTLPEELAVAKFLLFFPEMIEKVEEDLFLHSICDYTYSLAQIFSQFHTNCRCLYYNADKQLVSADKNRLILCIYAKKIMANCLEMLGFNLLECM